MVRAPRRAASKRRWVSSLLNLSSDMPKRRPIGMIVTADGKEYPMKAVTAREAKAILRPYSVELGHLATAWNQLHYNLSSLFTLLLKPHNSAAAGAIWHATDSDFTQRKMLRAIVEVDKTMLVTQPRLSALQAQEILWILDQIDDKLRHKRNNALHAPLIILRGVFDDAVQTWVEAHFDPQNPRAKPLRGKDLIEEFHDYTAHAEVLFGYAARIWMALNHADAHPWPERPSLPQAHKKKKSARRGIRKLPPHLRGA
jgi:hypothetical protein